MKPGQATAAPVFGEEPDRGYVDRAVLNFSWLLKLRWAAVIGQLTTILAVQTFVARLPIVILVSLVGVAALTNVAFVLWFRLTTRSEGWDSVATSGEALIGLIMVLDIFLLSGLLYVSGGPHNPFGIFYLVNVVLAAVLLRPLWGWVLGAVACVCYGGLFIGHLPLESLSVQPKMQAAGLFVAFTTATMIILYFFMRMTSELKRIEGELVLARQRRVRSQRLEAMATLAAGAAHELSSPLSTIAVVAKELERDLEAPSDLANAVEDAQLIRSQVARCREILDQMSADAGQSAGEPMIRASVQQLIDGVLDGIEELSRVEIEIGEGASRVELLLPVRALAQAIRGIVKNALDATEVSQVVHVRVRLADVSGDIELRVEDEGTGMDPATLDRVGNPFFTTKEPGKGMGLGVFLARTVVERLGGSLEFESTQGQGTLVAMRLPQAVS